MTGATKPPRFVPTLTEVVRPAISPNATPTSKSDISPQQLEEQVLHRVMQRVDLVLEKHLREAVGPLILAHTQALGPRLREEIERVVRESVNQAIAQELPL